MYPRIIIAGLSGGSGKTLLSLGLARSFAKQGIKVQPYKKGPDYVDTAWLSLAARHAGRNLDPFFLTADQILEHFSYSFKGADLAIIEGNRGYFDGHDLEGSCSTAALAMQLDAPVILVIDCTKMTRTVAALVNGCKSLPGGDKIVGVILNRIGNKRHGELAKKAVEEISKVKVLGVLPRSEKNFLLEKRQGLLLGKDLEKNNTDLDLIADFIGNNVNLKDIYKLIQGANPLPISEETEHPSLKHVLMSKSKLEDLESKVVHGALQSKETLGALRSKEALSTLQSKKVSGALQSKIKLGVLKDEVFWQYYSENLLALENEGAELVFLSLKEENWQKLDGLYLGGGDLEPYLEDLVQNKKAAARIQALALSGLPIYAEQAGFFYLGSAFMKDGKEYPMLGIFPFKTYLKDTPCGLGYVEVIVEQDTPFFPKNTRIKGHEFHYLQVHDLAKGMYRRVKGTSRGVLMDCLVESCVQGSCMQIFAPACPDWAKNFIMLAGSKY